MINTDVALCGQCRNDVQGRRLLCPPVGITDRFAVYGDHFANFAFRLFGRKPFVQRVKQRDSSAGLMRQKTLLIVSWEEMPLLKSPYWRSHNSCFLPNNSISSQSFASHKMADITSSRISDSCGDSCLWLFCEDL